MKAVEANLLVFLRKSSQLVIPIYQRTYSWTEQECKQLWDDILRAGHNKAVSSHFIGSVVYVEQGLGHVVNESPLLVIDGQQRLTTVSLILEALARKLGDEEPVDGFSARKIRNYYLLNQEESGDRRFKLLLTQTDRDSLLALMQQKPLPPEHSTRIEENFAFFQEKLDALGADLPAFCRGIAKLVVVDVALDRSQDNPQLIFESMNSTGRELSQADLIRNFILMGLEPSLQSQLYVDYWRPMEVAFGQDAYSTHFDAFMRHYLTMKTGEIPNLSAVYKAFKRHASQAAVESAGVEELVADIHRFAAYYCNVALGRETDPKLSQAFHDIRELKVDVAYPLLLELYHDYRTGMLQHDELVQAARMVESYVFRRAICAIPTNSMNKTFQGFARSLKKDRYLESIQAAFLMLQSYRRFPSDEEFVRDLKSKDLYHVRVRSYWLRRLENHGRKERVPVDEYTIEHILPQNEQLSPEWQADLGPDWKQVQEKYVHTLGNLTLTGYNAEYSDRPFLYKRDHEGGFAHSPLRMNDGLGQLECWNEETIQHRADRLASQALKVWTAPRLPADILQAYRPSAPTTGYSIEDHPQLASGVTRELFEAFRAQVLALDPVVTEEFLKLYVAYKAETNFVDVVPQAKRLRLSLNMPFPDITDPRGMCRDVSGLGRWGNGDVEVGLESLEDLQYVIGLVRQSFEQQMGVGVEA